METSLRQKLTDDLRQSMRCRNSLRCSVIRLLLSAVGYAEMAKQVPPGSFGDPDILGVLAKEVKQRHESIEAYQTGHRPDLAAKEEAELAILNEYMPKQASREEVTARARQIIIEAGAHGPQDKGKVMPRVIAEFKGKAEGKDINAVVTELLASL
jgi:uncharacterized protein YqeY